MKYFTQNQAQCIIDKQVLVINKYSDRFLDFKFETIVKVLKSKNEYIFYLNAIITESNSFSSRDIELHEFCKNNNIPLDYSDCI